MNSEKVSKRRATSQIERLLRIAEASQLSLLRNKHALEASKAKDSAKRLNTLEEIQMVNFAVIGILRWVLGIGLSDEEWQRIPRELDDAMS